MQFVHFCGERLFVRGSARAWPKESWAIFLIKTESKEAIQLLSAAANYCAFHLFFPNTLHIRGAHTQVTSRFAFAFQAAGERYQQETTEVR